MAVNATARRFRRKVSDEMRVRSQCKPHTPKGGDRGGIGGRVFYGVRLGIALLLSASPNPRINNVPIRCSLNSRKCV